ncbi:hypothetical protein [Prochlorococcus marinus]|uniref:hypothetical protein n=1 Tax=Prochlorococcus marinus TaxID=1219 RepID=UPI0022B3A864|nr:hypothetical protein [Prochlorococcus marinus]
MYSLQNRSIKEKEQKDLLSLKNNIHNLSKEVLPTSKGHGKIGNQLTNWHV